MCGALASFRPRSPGTPPYSILGESRRPRPRWDLGHISSRLHPSDSAAPPPCLLLVKALLVPLPHRQGCPDADHQCGIVSGMLPGRICNYTVKEEIVEIAAEEEAEVGRSIGQEFQTQQTMQRNKSNKHGLADHINNQSKRRTLISRSTTTPAKGASTRASFCHYQSPISSSLTSSYVCHSGRRPLHGPKPRNQSTLAHQDEDNPYRTQACSSWASTLSSIEPKAEAFDVAVVVGRAAASVEEGIEALQLYSKEVSRRLLDFVKSRSAAAKAEPSEAPPAVKVDPDFKPQKKEDG
ncbi:hypothetical protein ZWY2020_016014 [Hordeum vulgare]|nr:hypothetical protein ZWY2020_016014 [Hordeum vulgare]